MSILPVILSGGAGTRLWPVSRELHPKPFMRLADGQSLLQKTFARAAQLPGVREILTVTNRDLYFKTADEYRAVNEDALPTAFVLESTGRNTAPAIAAAALWVARTHGEHTLMLILAADHLIDGFATFAKAVKQGEELAEDGKLVTFGIPPTSPDTGFGYIEAEGHAVRRFVEKPSADKARELLEGGNCLWNSGMFLFRAGSILEEFDAHAAEVLAAARRSLDAAHVANGGEGAQIELDARSYQICPDISIDHAVMEHSARVAVVASDMGWSDIGSWSAVSDLREPDACGNRMVGDALLQGSKNCYVQCPDRVAGLVGVEDLIVVDTPDALLVAHRSRVQEVKQLVAQLKARRHDAYRTHREVHRPWGSFTVIEEGRRFKIKRIVVKPGASLSLQMHHHRSEHWIIVSGMARVVNGQIQSLVNTNESTYIPAATRHRLENPGVIDLVLIEVQCGDYLGEDDIVRLEDRYGRGVAAVEPSLAATIAAPGKVTS